ncbi:MAG TPA: hypothetical protein VNO26_16325 [Candidatus Limnocylindria bacterium]|nr:hypothetical protein [Candidatus Limnocylindria bacterium]
MVRISGKRAREKARQEHQREKQERKRRRQEAKVVVPRIPGEDPDIAGIVPGPQPVEEPV